jgi:hypothetical protein
MNSKDTITIDIGDLNLDQSISTGWNTFSIAPSNSFSITDYHINYWTDINNDVNEWREILIASEHNDALQKAIERVKILYYLSKEDGNSET